MKPTKVVIMGAAGRDFHNFNVCFRDDPHFEVVAFTAAQIPNIADRGYPPSLAGPRYRKGIPIYPEAELRDLILRHGIGQVIHAYSDVSHEDVMHAASLALAAGADFRILGPRSVSLPSTKPVIAVCAVRTGAGKSPTSQFIVDFLSGRGLRVGVVRHPMPYGDLESMEVQRFADYDDFAKYDTTIEEREEYEPYVRRGVVIWAGVDYLKILREAEKEADVLVWDGGNNDLPFYVPDLHITVVDPHRPGHGLTYHPGEANLRAADVVLVGKAETAPAGAIDEVTRTTRSVNPRARIFRTRLEISAIDPTPVRGKRVIVVEDGPTLTHGGMAFGAGLIFAREEGARVVDASRYAVGSIRKVYETYPHLEKILPAMGYGARQIREFEATINRAKADLVVGATPVDLARLIRVDKPIVQIRYSLVPSPAFRRLLAAFARKVRKGRKGQPRR
jgi:predicted GTPase